MYEHRKFDVEVVRTVQGPSLSWPAPGAAGDDSTLGGNRPYIDLRRLPWSEAVRVYELEAELISRVESADEPEDEAARIEDELYEDDVGLYGLDLGVASTVVALSSAQCVPFASCNAGAFGGEHHEAYPLVAFHASRQTLDSLLNCAIEADIGLVVEDTGEVVAYGPTIAHMRAFAGLIIQCRSELRAIRADQQKAVSGESEVAQQLDLPIVPELD